MTARFAIIGAGGLGGPVAYALAAAGAEALTLCDPDRVELSNLQRQVQYTTADIGRLKVEALADELSRRGYPRERVRTVAGRLDADTAAELLDGAGAVVDGTDDLATKFATNDAACARGIPAVIGGVLRYAGQVLAFVPGRTGCYRCLFEDPPEQDAQSCAEAGVLGAAVAVIGGAMARAALRLPDSAGQLHVYDDLTRSAEPRRVRYNPRPDCPACHKTAVPTREAL